MANLRADEDRAVEQLQQAGLDPYVSAWQQQPGGTTQYKRLTTALRTPQGYGPIYCDKKRWRALPLVEAKALAKFAPYLRYFCTGVGRLWCGVVTLNQPCLVADVGNQRSETLTAVRRFFEKRQSRAELIFTIIHEPTCGCVDSGQALVHVHAHFLFAWNTNESSERAGFEAAFSKRFPTWSGIEPVRDREAYISYILRAPDLRPLLDTGEYVTWALAVQGRRRMCRYGKFRRKLAQLRKQRKTIVTTFLSIPTGKRSKQPLYVIHKPPQKPRRATPRSSPYVVPTNTVVGTTMITTPAGPSVAAIVKNPVPDTSTKSSASFASQCSAAS
jgi:hypothetical protein